AVRRELLAVRAYVCRRKPNFFSKIVPVRHRSENRVFTTKHFSSFREVAFFDRVSNRCAAHDHAVYLDRWNPYDVEIKLRPKFFEKIEIAPAIFPERPFMTDTDFAERLCMSN